MAFGLQFTDNLLHACRHVLKFPQLIVRITPEGKSTVIRNTHFVAIGQFNAQLAQETPQRPNAIPSLSATCDNGKHIGLGTDVQLRNECSHNRRQIEVIGRENQTDAFLIR